MRSLVLTALTLLFPCTLPAKDSAKSLPEKIRKTNEQVKEMTGPQPPCATCASSLPEEDAPAWKSCIRQLCPEGTGQMSKAIMDSIHKMDLAQLVDVVTIDGAVTAAAEQRLELDKILLKAWNDDLLVKDPKVAALMRLMESGANTANLHAAENGKLDDKASLDTFVAAGLTLEDFEDAKKLYESAKSLEVPPLLQTGYTFLAEEMKAEEMRAQALTLLTQIDKDTEELAARLGVRSELLSGDERKSLRQQLEDKHLSSAIMESLKDSWRSTKLMLGALPKTGFSRKGHAAISIRKKLDEKAVSSLKQRIAEEELYVKAAKSSPLDKTLKPIKDQCYYAYFLGQALAPSAGTAAGFAEKEKGLRKEYAQRAGRLLSTHSREVLERDAPKWALMHIKSKEEAREEFMASIRNESANDKASIERLRNLNPQELQLIAAVSTPDAGKAAAELQPYSSLKELCTDLAPQILDDFALPGKNWLHISERTVNDLEHHKQALFHEYSHMMSHIIQDAKDISPQTAGWYKSLRQCLNEQHGDQPAFEEEDFAETIASVAAPEAEDYLCSGEVEDDSSEKYFHLKANDFDQQHSGTVYSMLIKHLARTHEIPQICRSALAAKGETKLPQDCLGKMPQAKTAKAM